MLFVSSSDAFIIDMRETHFIDEAYASFGVFQFHSYFL